MVGPTLFVLPGRSRSAILRSLRHHAGRRSRPSLSHGLWDKGDIRGLSDALASAIVAENVAERTSRDIRDRPRPAAFHTRFVHLEMTMPGKLLRISHYPHSFSTMA